MKDPEIRQCLKNYLKLTHGNQEDTLLIDELSLCMGDARADLVVVNGSFHGYEIKSDRDTLNRLEHQRSVYGRCFDSMTLVVARKHLSSAKRILPQIWGILEVTGTDSGQCCLIEHRAAKLNKRPCAYSLAQFLWKAELIEATKRLGIPYGPTVQTRIHLINHVSKNASLDDLRQFVREAFRARGNWRAGSSPFRNDDSPQSPSKSERYQETLRWLLSRQSACLPN